VEAKTRAADRRVGRTPEARLRWLLDFVRREMKAKADYEGARWEAWVFVAGLPGPRDTPSEADLLVRALAPNPLPSLLDRDPRLVVEALRLGLRVGLDQLREVGRLRLPVGTSIAGGVRAPGGRLVPTFGGSTPEDRFWAAVMMLLLTESDRLRLCADRECREWFVARGRRQYCRDRCRHRVGSARWAEVNRERARALKRASYKRVVARRRGVPVHRVRIQQRARRN
jgi:hypothetical protein